MQRKKGKKKLMAAMAACARIDLCISEFVAQISHDLTAL